jgi:hypothetical protein
MAAPTGSTACDQGSARGNRGCPAGRPRLRGWQTDEISSAESKVALSDQNQATVPVLVGGSMV